MPSEHQTSMWHARLNPSAVVLCVLCVKHPLLDMVCLLLTFKWFEQIIQQTGHCCNGSWWKRDVLTCRQPRCDAISAWHGQRKELCQECYCQHPR